MKAIILLSVLCVGCAPVVHPLKYTDADKYQAQIERDVCEAEALDTYMCDVHRLRLGDIVNDKRRQSHEMMELGKHNAKYQFLGGGTSPMLLCTVHGSFATCM